MASRKKVTINDIARAARVSVATVSNVLNGKETVDQSIRDTVLGFAGKMGYSRIRRRPSNGAAAKMIAMVSPDVTDPVMASIFKGVENVAQIHGYLSILCDSMNSGELENEHIENLVHRGIDGLIVQPTGTELPSLALLRRRSFPFVIVDRKISETAVNSVVSDNLDGAYQAVKYLLSLGHRDICFISGSSAVSTGADRAAGYGKALNEAGIASRDDLVIEGKFTWTDAFQGVETMLREGRRFTAVFAANDIMALAARAAIEKHGMRVPEDFSVVGYNDILYASAISLTTVALDPLEMGKNATLLLLDLISKRRRPPHSVTMTPRLIIRNSCRKVD
jgi:LacI family transcriptional regulator